MYSERVPTTNYLTVTIGDFSGVTVSQLIWFSKPDSNAEHIKYESKGKLLSRTVEV
jgi:hypothetical protein